MTGAIVNVNQTWFVTNLLYLMEMVKDCKEYAVGTLRTQIDVVLEVPRLLR